ncbi:MAG TPA: glycosyltransferase family 9 protein [Nitrospirota bacterium]|nr:glycosyltransferase family 9 protein [Nitrospirota bacterium]
MNVDTMRKLDRYAGVPLCFLGSVIKALVSFLRPQAEKNVPPRRILFIGLSEMGSTILADPAMIKLKRALNADLYFAIFLRNKPSLELLSTISNEKIIVLRDSGIIALVVDTVRYLIWTRRNAIDTVIDLELFSRFTALLTGISGAARTAGFHSFYAEGLYRGNFLTHRVAYNPHQHMAKNFLALANAVLSDREEVPYSKTIITDEEIIPGKVAISGQARDAMLDRVRKACPTFDPNRHRIVLFNTDASELIPLRRWPQEHFVKLAKMVLEKHPRVIILLTGDISERTNKDIIIRSVNNERCVNFAGQTTIQELPKLYSLSTFMLTNDSGPAHFASVTDMPAFVLFGPETPKLYGPLGAMTPIYAGLACSPCVSAANHRKTACNDNVCLKMITPEKVYEILKSSLEMLR